MFLDFFCCCCCCDESYNTEFYVRDTDIRDTTVNDDDDEVDDDIFYRMSQGQLQRDRLARRFEDDDENKDVNDDENRDVNKNVDKNASVLPCDTTHYDLPSAVLQQLFANEYAWFAQRNQLDGHCFFRAFSCAYNTHPTHTPSPFLTVSALRMWLAQTITPTTYPTMLRNYNTYLHRPLLKSLEELQCHVQQRQHYATREDIAIIQAHLPYAYPLIINSFFGDKHIPATAKHLHDVPIQCVLGFPAAHETAFFILLLHDPVVEHYELICHVGKRVSSTLATPVYQGVFAWHELPAPLQEHALMCRTISNE